MPKFTVLMTASVPVWKRVQVEAVDLATAERDALDGASDDLVTDGWHMGDDGPYPEGVVVAESAEDERETCPQCHSPMHQCATGETGCYHCNECDFSHAAHRTRKDPANAQG